MSVFIKGMSLIAPNWDCEKRNFHLNLNADSLPYLSCLEPDYKQYINPIAIRRMSKVLKMGNSSAKLALIDSELDNVDAIILGTGFGCFSDTTVFLDSMLDNDEKQLTPTAFIQSTHNSVNSQIALMLKCNGYNYTYSHRGLSFENALIDASMLLEEKEAANVLVGGFDEITDVMYEAIKSSVWFPDGSILGESCAMFVLTSVDSPHNYCKIEDVATYNEVSAIEDNVNSFLKKNNLEWKDINLVLSGTDSNYLHKEKNIIRWKHLMGESMTASADALILAAIIIESQRIPEELAYRSESNNKIDKILIINTFGNLSQSLILVTRC